jgi:hypothetical protein
MSLEELPQYDTRACPSSSFSRVCQPRQGLSPPFALRVLRLAWLDLGSSPDLVVVGMKTDFPLADFGTEIELELHSQAVDMGKERLEVETGEALVGSNSLDHLDHLVQGHGRAGSQTF